MNQPNPSRYARENGIAQMHSFASITPLILAAGDSTRMGFPKALLPIGESTFLTHILETARAAGLGKPVVVLGKAADLILPVFQGRPAAIRINPDPDRGQLSSVQIGLSAISQDALAFMVWPVDQPAVSETLVRGLACLFMESEPPIACPKYGGRRGHPAIFHRKIFREFMEAPIEEGPKKIIERYRKETAELPTSESGVVLDVDTPSDYEALTGESLETALLRRQL